MAVAITGGRIASIRPSAGASVPRGAKVVDAAGKYLIPGLWDMHVHLTEAPPEGDESAPPVKVDARAYYFPLLVANGILGARDMGGVLDTLISWRQEITAGRDPRASSHGHGIQAGVGQSSGARSASSGRDSGSSPHLGRAASPTRRRLCESGFRARERGSLPGRRGGIEAPGPDLRGPRPAHHESRPMPRLWDSAVSST